VNTAPASNRRAAAARPDRINWRRAVVYGLLWAVTIMVTETFVQPLDAMSLSKWLWFELGMMQWAVAGVALASATMLLEHRLRPWMTAPAVVAFSLLVTAGWWQFGTEHDQSPYSSTWFEGSGRLHVFWSAMVYGGLFVAAYRLSMQSERTRELLAQAEIARQETETLLSEAEFLSLQGHVDPAFLLRVMIEVEHRYAHDPAGMGRLLDPLVNFLRAAMPGVRSGASTLAAEVLLAGQYAQVWAELEADRATWNIRVEGLMPDLPFPPLLLLPVLDQLATGAPRRVELQVAQTDERCILALTRGVPFHEFRLAPQLLYRLQVGLSAVFGDAWELQSSPASPAYVLTLPMARTMSEVPVSSQQFASPNQQETTHG
jgi:hypothetical protein